MDLAQRALLFAVEKHDGQYRERNRKPFVFHPLRVGMSLANQFKDIQLEAAGYLHDVVEDTYTTEADISARFGARVADLVMMVTKLPGKPWPYPTDPDGVRLKVADTLDNVNDNIQDGWKPRVEKVAIWRHLHQYAQGIIGDEFMVIQLDRAISTFEGDTNGSRGNGTGQGNGPRGTS